MHKRFLHVIAKILERFGEVLTPVIRSPRSRHTLVVIDTNVLMAGLIAPHKPSGKILDLWEKGNISPIVSQALWREYMSVFNRMRFGSRESVSRREEKFSRLMKSPHLVRVKRTKRLDLIRECPADNKLLECALAGRAAYIVSQDRHLLKLGEYKGVTIVTAREFLRREFPETLL